MPNQHDATPEASPWVFAAEAAQILGIGRDTLIRLTDAGEIPCWRPTQSSQRRYDSGVLAEYRARAAGSLAAGEQVTA